MCFWACRRWGPVWARGRVGSDTPLHTKHKHKFPQTGIQTSCVSKSYVLAELGSTFLIASSLIGIVHRIYMHVHVYMHGHDSGYCCYTAVCITCRTNRHVGRRFSRGSRSISTTWALSNRSGRRTRMFFMCIIIIVIIIIIY